MKKIILLVGVILTVLIVAACGPVSTDDVETQEPLPTSEPLPTDTPLPTSTPLSTEKPTDIPSPTSTFTPTVEVATPEPILVEFSDSISKYVLREVCFNVNGFVYNNKGLPVISDCVYPLKGIVADRIKYFAGDQVEVEEFGDLIFSSVHGFESNGGEITIKADGSESYYVAKQRGENGELLFIPAWLVELLTN